MRWPTWVLSAWGVFCALTGMVLERAQKSPTHAAWCPPTHCEPCVQESCFIRWAPEFSRGADNVTREDVVLVPRCRVVDGRDYVGPCIDSYQKIVRAVPAPINSVTR